MENSTREDVDCDHTENVSSIITKVQKLLQFGCRCHRGLKGDQCLDYLKVEIVISNLYDCLELSHETLDLVILANLQAFTEADITGRKRKTIQAYSFLYQSHPICKEMFLHVYGISKSRFQRLLEHYQNHDISLRVHGNSKRLPHNTLPQAVAVGVKSFVSNYAQENAVLLPGRIPGFKNEDIVLLSSSETKMHVWNCFKRACEVASKRVVSYMKFFELWQQFHPNLVMANR